MSSSKMENAKLMRQPKSRKARCSILLVYITDKAFAGFNILQLGN